MKNTILTIVKSISINSLKFSFVSLLSLTAFLSCVSIPHSVIDKAFPRADSKPPVDAFALVTTKTTITPGECFGPTKNRSVCEEALKVLPPVTRGGIGSGLLIKAKTKTIFLTAAHVCLTDVPEFHESHGIKISLNSKTIIKIRTSSGKNIAAKIEKIDKE